MSGWFIAGSGTEVGKTWVTCSLARAWRAAGRPVRAVKPLASGAAAPDHPDFALGDTARLLAAQGSPLDAADVDACTPWRFAAPLAPDMAAAAEGRRVDFAEVAAWTRAVAAATPAHGRVLVEGVGGLMSPLAEDATNLDLARAAGLPVVLVCGSYLGAISHGLCALAAARVAGLEVAVLAVNETPSSTVGLAETAAAFARFAGGTPVRVLRHGEPAAPAALGLPPVNAASAPLWRSRTPLREAIAARAMALGFDAFGAADLDAPWTADAALRTFVAEGRHGEMDWMATTLERRVHPRALWPQARSALVLGLNYGPDADPRAAAAWPERGAISVYAQADDYHELIKGRLKTLAQWLRARAGCEAKVFVDTAPVMEKPLAAAAGLGFQGKHTNLVSRAFGSWLFLGVVLTTLTFDADPNAEAEGGGCGTCRACLDACPTDAFPAPYRIDARRCISYLTIEHGGPVDPALRPALGSRIYGCDDCLAACPWNKFARTGREMRLHARDDLRAPPLAELAELDEAGFRALFRKSPVRRIGRDRFVRNVLYAIGNSREPGLAAAAERRLDDLAPLVRGAAVWALGRLLAPERFAALHAARAPAEADPQVRTEWASAATSS